ncbi:MAG TPA: urease subunit beta [Nitrospiraceae bacterium]|nr:urease subunit beta [Nitrospiraceae bacterium]
MATTRKRVEAKRHAAKKRKSKTSGREQSLAATIRAELAKPVIPGEVVLGSGDIEAFAGRETKQLVVTNAGDRPVQVGSHCHFFEVNRALHFDRAQAFGFKLCIPAGTAARFEPGEEKKVTLVAFAGKRVVHGINNLTNGSLDDSRTRTQALAQAAERGFIAKGGTR